MPDHSAKTDVSSPPAKTKRKMRPGGGKQKGSGFENQVAKKLSAALDPLKFIRTQGSGARVGGKNFETIGKMFGADALKLFVGDVVPVNERECGHSFKFSVECKFYKTPDSFPSLVAGSANIFKWMQEAEEDAVKIKRNAVLIFKWNNVNTFAATYFETPCHKLIIDALSGKKIFVSYLDELLTYPNFWYESTLQ